MEHLTSVESLAECVIALSSVRFTFTLTDAAHLRRSVVVFAGWQMHALSVVTSLMTVAYAAAGGSRATLIISVCIQAAGAAGALAISSAGDKP